jgi:hypothetical protein
MPLWLEMAVTALFAYGLGVVAGWIAFKRKR